MDPRRGGRAPASWRGQAAAQGPARRVHGAGHRGYAEARDDLAPAAPRKSVGKLQQYGEISARTCWWAGRRAIEGTARRGAETFLKELVWRDFAHHLVFHTPHHRRAQLARGVGTPFPGTRTRTRPRSSMEKGQDGHGRVDARDARDVCHGADAQPRARCSWPPYLTKHLLSHWKIGMDWFEDCLVDWDPASNAMGWQWSSGSGPDATPYFRVFNPETQAEKFRSPMAGIAGNGWRSCPRTRLRRR